MSLYQNSIERGFRKLSIELSSLNSVESSMMTPVLFIIFNRPETTLRVFEEIRKVRPARLYIAADGPRENHDGDAARCEEARSVVSNIDWECDVRQLFRDKNLGCGKGVSGAITWFFEHEPEGIILEDDCHPSPLFFTFCAELLERYRHDTRIMEIGGNNFEPAHLRDEEYSYWFSNHVSIWGWATWRRAWKLYDFTMGHFNEIKRKEYLNASYDSIYERDYFEYVFEEMHNGSNRTWDYQWQFACKINSGLTIVPNHNLIVNIGFGDSATNTHDPKAVGHDVRWEDISFPLKHPEFVMANQIKGRQVFYANSTSPISRIKSQIKNLIPRKLLTNLVKPVMNFFAI